LFRGPAWGWVPDLRVNDARGCASGKFLTCIQNDHYRSAPGTRSRTAQRLLGMWGGTTGQDRTLARAEGWSVGELMAYADRNDVAA
jgi:hypothetical protein